MIRGSSVNDSQVLLLIASCVEIDRDGLMGSFSCFHLRCAYER